ncbi:MAG: adenylosuccinate synthase [Candidatus Eisenbacteria bacterium]|uniref:Adenylosuccinate synthetase n=1 Tax=Eiseniibacteriota bacterium TaxID=2212470 RepID=A0A849SL44_UNCEI|nr:adenylosuccinate synthase [Candidatus Eisenbacteria bacterium]
MPCTVVVGAQWGDEGKGKIVDALSANADVVARYQGGPNAGHSVVRGAVTTVLHLVPSGIMVPGVRCLIGNGVVVDLERLREEVSHLEAIGIEVAGRLGVSAGAHLILPYHRAVEAVAEQGPGAIGTTGRGIGFAYRDKAARVGLRVGDAFDRQTFVERCDRNLARLRREFPEAAPLASMSGGTLFDSLEPLRRWLEPMVCDASLELHEALAAGKRVLLEGAQGTLLDLDHGTYPFVTSSPASASGATLGVGLGPRVVDRVIGVAKAYATRVGHGPFPTEMPPDEAARLREAGEEYGATTGRPRRCGWLDLPALRYAARVNSLDEIVFTKLDVLDEFETIRVATDYALDGQPVHGFPTSAAALERCVPVWREFAGWKSPTTAVRKWTDLPGAARAYLEWVEQALGVPIRLVSVGAAPEAEVPRR